MEYIEQLILKWLDGDISPEELKTLEESVDLESLGNTLEAQENMQLETSNESILWDNIQKEIRKPTAEQGQTTSDTTPKTGYPKRWLWMALAAIILGSITINVFLKNPKKEIETKPQQEEEILMVDNTTIRLAPASYLSWNADGWEDARILDLKGQAFFGVPTKGDFLVRTSLGEISVKGTSFDIWEVDDSRLRVQCFTGVVEVENLTGVDVELKAGQEVYLANDDFSKVGTLTNSQPDWFSGGLNYQNIPFSSIFNDLNRFYGLDVTSEGIDNSTGFTGYLPMNDLDNAIEIIMAVSGWKNERPNQNSLVFKK